MRLALSRHYLFYLPDVESTRPRHQEADDAATSEVSVNNCRPPLFRVARARARAT